MTRRAAPRGRASWIELRAVVVAGAAEAAAEILRDLRTGGLVEEHPAPDRIRFRCYLPPSRQVTRTVHAVRERLRALAGYGLDPRPSEVGYRYLTGRRWATAWRTYARAVRIGRFVVRPSWMRVTHRPGDVVVAIDPGMAFGTGMHASTRLALRGLVRALRVRPGATVFDVGTGSGVLAIAAAALGASRVWAVDSDPVATSTARANARSNGFARRIRVVTARGLDRARGRAGIIVANIVADTIIELAGGVRRHLEARGVFVGSGLVAGRVRDVLRAARAAGLQPVAVLREGDWRAVVLSAARPDLRRSGGRRSRQPVRR